MVILKKKKIIYLILCTLLGISVYGLKEQKNINSMETVATPVASKVVVLDAGHGGEDGGATSKNNISEADINLKITLKVQKLLEQSGATVILTRSDKNAIYDLDKDTLREKKVSDLKNRVKIGNENSADIFVSIHLNKIEQEQYYGWQTFFKDGCEKSRILAQSIQKNLNNSIQKENKREALKISGIYIVDNVEVPISIVECGFLSNKEEEIKLQQEDYQSQLAWGIYMGIMDYFFQT